MNKRLRNLVSESNLDIKVLKEHFEVGLLKFFQTGYKRAVEDAVNLLMVQHEAAKSSHNYWHVAANLIKAELVHASDTSEKHVHKSDKNEHEGWYGQWQWQCGYERGWDKAMERKREWVGLTDEDIWQLRREGAQAVSDKDFKAIEAKLKEKNT